MINEGKITNPEEDAQFVHETHAEREQAANEDIMKDKEEEKVHRMTAYSSNKNEWSHFKVNLSFITVDFM